MKNRFTVPDYFFSLDILRGLAAVAVVFSHWAHFLPSTFIDGHTKSDFPFYSSLKLFYEKGGLAVDLFFTLSGTIFFWLYSIRIRSGFVGFRHFILLRLSRLYPLHFITFILMAGLQIFYFSENNAFFICNNNDPYHFVLQLFFISDWGLQSGHSFNAPVWSVSIEVLLYIVFFLFCRYCRFHNLAIVALIVAGAFIRVRFNIDIGRGIYSFFLGGLTFRFFEKSYDYILSRKMEKYFYLLTLLAWGIAIGLFQSDSLPEMLSFLTGKTGLFLVLSIVFPLTVFCLMLLETQKKNFGKNIAMIGNWSYSLYLIHFPLQLVIVCISKSFGFNDTIYHSTAFCMAFFVLLISLSNYSYKYIEVPARNFIRKRLKLVEKKTLI